MSNDALLYSAFNNVQRIKWWSGDVLPYVGRASVDLVDVLNLCPSVVWHRVVCS